MKAICGSVNFDLFMVLPRPAARITHPLNWNFPAMIGPETGKQVKGSLINEQEKLVALCGMLASRPRRSSPGPPKQLIGRAADCISKPARPGRAWAAARAE